MDKEGCSWTPLLWDDLDSRTREIVEKLVEDSPNLPVHVHKLLDIITDPRSEAVDVANAASADPGLVSRILQVVNSSYYGLSKKTDNIHFAIVLLGFDEVRKIALQVSFSGLFKEGKGGDGYDTTGLWKHSYLVSVCAETLGRAESTKRAGELLTLGILHDVGKFALFRLAVAMKEKGIAPHAPGKNLENSSLVEKEEALFRVNHPIVGSMLARKWDLSERICAVLEYHHHPSFFPPETIPGEYLRDVATVSVSDAIVNRMSGKDNVPEPAAEYFEIVGLTPPIDECITGEIKEKLDDAMNFMSAVE